MKILNILLLFLLSTLVYGQNLTTENISKVKLNLLSDHFGGNIVVFNNFNNLLKSDISLKDLTTKEEFKSLQDKLEAEKRNNKKLEDKLNTAMKKLAALENKIRFLV